MVVCNVEGVFYNKWQTHSKGFPDAAVLLSSKKPFDIF